MNVNRRIFEHWETTLLGAAAAACTVGVPLIISGTLDRESIYLAMFFSAVGALAKTPGKDAPQPFGDDSEFDDPG